ncbi:DUF4236 domain-containing protein [Sphingomonas tabacisoli]|uniref:DUF4236 domain-containing protein n=1 Tax=Sphingomonas tabacisoli TaxID=2249466 RepID=A0ABW4I1M1_9SPHN
MGFRFRRSVRLMPGVRLNFSSRGVSTSLGGRGATVNLSRRGTRATVGIPGSGLSYSTLLSRPVRRPSLASSARPAISPVAGWIVIGVLLLMLAMCASGRSGTPFPSPEPAAVPSTTATLRTVTGNDVNCRAAPSKAGAVVAKLSKGDQLSVLAQAPEWTKLVHPGGDCWVSNSLLAG